MTLSCKDFLLKKKKKKKKKKDSLQGSSVDPTPAYTPKLYPSKVHYVPLALPHQLSGQKQEPPLHNNVTTTLQKQIHTCQAMRRIRWKSSTWVDDRVVQENFLEVQAPLAADEEKDPWHAVQQTLGPHGTVTNAGPMLKNVKVACA
jgi:hypothetical protein